jgi:hypothetical protein
MPAKKKVPGRNKCRHCDNLAYSRGVCQKHNKQGQLLVLSGKFTDQKLVAVGYWAESKPSGRPPEQDDVVQRLLATSRRK